VKRRTPTNKPWSPQPPELNVQQRNLLNIARVQYSLTRPAGGAWELSVSKAPFSFRLLVSEPTDESLKLRIGQLLERARVEREAGETEAAIP